MFSSVKDDNFCFPIPDVLETAKLKLVPFIPALHAEAIINSTDKDAWHYIPFGPFSSAQEFIEGFYERWIHPRRGETLFIGLDKTKLNTDGEPTPLGMCGYVHTEPDDLWTELFVLVLPQARHTHVASHMIGLLMRYALNLPAEGGLGLRRVQWSANVKNEGSIGLARKMGMRIEGVKRWARVLEVEKAEGGNGIATRKGDPREECAGRDTVTLAICWDEWEDEGKEQVERILAM
ncbi:acyl-CoA N-acyltransferase [Lentinula boryana]|uniref:Acyl-CoA N-acyltransferase n=1 Tax=Lentinula boryana TaxID=40481 RepID=A0ABQ8QFP2_9AGAR|nr:acyl-CoA N-acyltransferase [Lentinula boryana]